jgi:hypothetical protein
MGPVKLQQTTHNSGNYGFQNSINELQKWDGKTEKGHFENSQRST